MPQVCVSMDSHNSCECDIRRQLIKDWQANFFVAAYPLQAYLMTKLILVFGESDEKLQSDSQHWALMFTALACTTGASYFLVGWASSTLSTVSICALSLITIQWLSIARGCNAGKMWIYLRRTDH